ncbi:MAG: PRC-barrel domain-containing protein [Beijerinckiaceae bacterium]
MTATIKSAMLAATLFGAGFAGAAIAQTAAPAPAQPPATTAPMTAPPANTAARAAMMEAKGPWLGTQMWKQAVYTADNETRIGEIDNLIINRSGQIDSVVVGVGGFLGLGEKNVSFKYTDLTPMVRDGNIWYMVKMTKEQINALPSFDNTKYKL